MGKGSTPRPIRDREQYESNFDNAFGKKCPKCGTVVVIYGGVKQCKSDACDYVGEGE